MAKSRKATIGSSSVEATARQHYEGNAKTLTKLEPLVRAVELVGVSLMNTQATFHPEAYSGDDAFDPPPQLTIKPPEFRAAFSSEDRILFCGVRFHVYLGEVDKPLGEVHAEYALTYKVAEGVDCPNDVASMFASANAVFNAWPFFREHAHALAGKMPLPAVLMPVFRLPVRALGSAVKV